jgi:hypothetical protein
MDTVSTKKHDVAIIDDRDILVAVIEVDEREWVTDRERNQVALSYNDLRKSLGKMRYDWNAKNWQPYRDVRNAAPETLDWEKIRSGALSRAAPPPEWPKGVRPITLNGMALFGLDKDLALYWDGKLVEIKKTVSLNRWQNFLANVAAFSALAVAIVEVATFIMKRG